ncbi:MAG: hypothetical protein IT521_01995 [Burkholderiales bacterium]|nr:hypothetical protein [Burkholderiales bacterium]
MKPRRESAPAVATVEAQGNTKHTPSDSTASPPSPHTHELVVIRPADGRAIRWRVYPSRDAADTERVKLAKIGMYAIVRRIERAP